jgi:hypothetical protein
MEATPHTNYRSAGNVSTVYQNIPAHKAESELVKLAEGYSVMSHSLVFQDLNPDTLYQYRVGDGTTWSEWSQFRTAAAEFRPFTFIFLGDPQNMLKTFCSRVFRTAYSKAPEARFVMLPGDLVTRNWSDVMWGEFYYAAGWIPRMIPFIMVPGNHEYFTRQKWGMPKRLTPYWRPQFRLPENGPSGLEESAYYIDYQGVRLIMLNGNEKLEQQRKWLKGVLENNNSRWTILCIHQPFYSIALERDHRRQRELFIPLIDEHKVDLVLQGHDHGYARSHELRAGRVVVGDERGTIYVVSIAGPKAYAISSKFKDLMVKTATGIQLYQIIKIEANKLSFEAWTVTDKLFDSFTLTKK